MSEITANSSIGAIGLSKRARAVAPFEVMEIVGRANQKDRNGDDVIHLEVGEPKFPIAPSVAAACHAYLSAGRAQYTEAAGMPALREAIAAHYQRVFGITVEAERIVVTNGASGALVLAMAATMDPGQALLTADPSYPCNRQIARILGCDTQLVPASAAHGFQLRADQVASLATDQTGAVLVASPSNPTGTLIEPAELAALYQLCQTRQLPLIVDEIYQGLVYGQDPSTALAIGDPWIVNSFSKYFGLTGMRLGWLVCPPGLSGAVTNLAQHLFISPSSLSQAAGLACFEPEAIAVFEARRVELAQARDYLIDALTALGFTLADTPAGAYYLFFDISKLSDSSAQLASELLEHANVATTPGHDFGPTFAATHLRVAYVDDRARLEAAVSRIRGYLQARR